MTIAERIALDKRIAEDLAMEKKDANFLSNKIDPQYEVRRRRGPGGEGPAASAVEAQRC